MKEEDLVWLIDIRDARIAELEAKIAEKDREIDHLKSSLATIYKMINIYEPRESNDCEKEV